MAPQWCGRAGGLKRSRRNACRGAPTVKMALTSDSDGLAPLSTLAFWSSIKFFFDLFRRFVAKL
jgi:hypothetical protein